MAESAMQRIRREGRAAGYLGRPPSACPYKTAEKASQWRAGHAQGQAWRQSDNTKGAVHGDG